MLFSDLRPQVWFSRRREEPSLNNYSLALHTRDSVSRRHRSTLHPTERLSLMLVFLASFFFTKKCYSMVAISHRESTKAAQQCRAICFVRAHAPKLCKCQKREQCHFKLTGSASVCTRRSFYQARLVKYWTKLIQLSCDCPLPAH